MATSDNGHVVDEKVLIRCSLCGEKMQLTPEQARMVASAMLAAAAGMERVELEVRGEG